MHTHPYILRTDIRIYISKHTHTQTHVYICVYIYIYIYIYTLLISERHAYTHTHIYIHGSLMYTQAHTHTHTYICPTRIIKTGSKRYIQVFPVTRVGHWWLIIIYGGLTILMIVSLSCTRQGRNNILPFSETIAISLYCTTWCRQRRQFDVLCLVRELVGTRRSRVFKNFKSSPLLWFNILSFSTIQVYFVENAPDEKLSPICFLVF